MADYIELSIPVCNPAAGVTGIISRVMSMPVWPNTLTTDHRPQQEYETGRGDDSAPRLIQLGDRRGQLVDKSPRFLQKSIIITPAGDIVTFALEESSRGDFIEHL